MNFYIGNSIENLDLSSENIEFSDELIEFVYQNESKMDFDSSSLSQIDPYKDVLICNTKLVEILNICENLLKTNILDSYDDFDEANESIKGLSDLCQLAITKNLSLISIGD